MQRQTTQLTKEQVANGSKKWFLVDAAGKPLGRLASEIAVVLMGKEKVDYTPSVDCGDYVIVINASKVYLSGNKLKTKNYYDNKRSSYGGLRTRSAKVMIEQWYAATAADLFNDSSHFFGQSSVQEALRLQG